MFSMNTNAPQKFKQRMNGIAKKDMPFVSSVALNKTAWDLKRELDKELEKSLDRPTPFTKKAVRVRNSSKKHLVAYLAIAPIQANYLRFAIHGGTRRPQGRALLYPVGQRVNKYGNMPRRAVSRLANSPRTFSGIPRGRTTPGLYKRVGAKGKKGLRLMVSYQSRADYKKRFDFYGVSEKTALKVMGKNFVEARRKVKR